MPFKVGAVANYVLDLGDRDDVPVSPMKLQKLVYLAHGWHLALANEPLIDEEVEAWQYGPVIPTLYHEFKHFGSRSIDGYRFTKPRRKPNGEWVLRTLKMPDGTDEAETARTVIERVWEVYKDLTAVQLSNLTHKPGTPWSETWESMGGVKLKGKDIDNDLIRDKFRELSEP